MDQDLTCEEFLKLTKLDAPCALRGAELQKLFWKVRGIEKEVERQKAFWASTNQTLESVYRELEAKTAELWDKNKKVQSILEHIEQGICTIDESLVIQPEHSAHLNVLLSPWIAQAPAGISIVDALLKPSSLNDDKRAQLLGSLENILGYDALAYELNAEYLLSEITMILPGPQAEKRDWEIDWIPIENQAGSIEKMMICMRDVTDLRRARFEAESQRIELEKIGQLLNVPWHAWERFSSGAQEQIDRARKLLTSPQLDPAQSQSLNTIANDVFMQLHTLKGNARTYGLSHLSQAAHIAEQRYVEFRHAPTTSAWILDELLADLDQIQASLESYRQIVHERLRNYASISAEQLTFGSLLKPILDAVPALARQLGKAPPNCVVQGGDIEISPHFINHLEGLLNHIIRNSLDHGLTHDAQGELRLELTRSGSELTLCCRDNGRGLDLAKLRQKHSNPNCSDQEAAELIFSPGISTAAQVTDISGRGIGMGAIRQLAHEMGGSVQIELDPAEPQSSTLRRFTLRLNIPTPRQ